VYDGSADDEGHVFSLTRSALASSRGRRRLGTPENLTNFPEDIETIILLTL
jgi:hypothetical protein